MMTEMTRYKQQADLEEEDISSIGSGRTVEFAGGGTTRIRCHIGSSHFWRSRSLLEKFLFFLSVLLLLVILVLSCLVHSQPPIAIPYHFHTIQDHFADPSSPCMSSRCVQIAGSIISRMNTSVDPCDDFYQYACGGWVSKSIKPEGKPSWGTLDIIASNDEVIMKKALESPEDGPSVAERKAKIFFRSCIDANDTTEDKGAQPLKELIKTIGGWSLSDNWELEEDYDMEADIFRSKGEYASGALFTWGVAEDDKNSSRYVLQFDQGGLMLPARDFYLNKSDQAVKDAYVKYITRIGVLLGASESESKQVANNIVQFEEKLAEIASPDEDRRDDEKNYHSMTLNALTEKAPFMNWKDFVNHAYRRLHNKKNFVPETQVVVYAPEFMANLTKILDETAASPSGNRTIHDYLTWHIIKNYLGFLSRDFTEAYSILQKAQLGISSAEDTWRECVRATDAAFGLALGAMYVRRVFSEEARGMATTMLEGIQGSFKERLHKVTWMVPNTKQAALEKTDYITHMIGYPDYILNPQELDKKFEELQVSENSFFENNVNVTNFKVKETLLRVFKPVNKTKWDMTPPTVNAYYSPTRNDIVLPAGILQPPLFGEGHPDALNYGAVGVIMGHELSHAFDDQGRKYDKDGNLHSWWDEVTIKRFKRKAQCMVDQYSEYTLGQEHLKGKLTLGENIADNGGLKASFNAYQQTEESKRNTSILPGLNLKANQLFFLSFAQIWCSTITKEAAHLEILRDSHVLPEFRVKGTLSNSEDFTRAFECPPDSPMVRKKRCIVW